MVHAENGQLIDFNVERLLKKGITGPEGHYYARLGEVDTVATHTAIAIACTINTPLYVVHVMKRAAAEEMLKAKSKGYVVYGEALALGLSNDASGFF